MNEYKKLYKQIKELNNKIKKIELSIENKPHKNNNDNNNFKSLLQSYKIHFPKDSFSNKKYVGLKFDDNFNAFDSDEKSTNRALLSFIRLKKSNVIINYAIQLELNHTPITSIPCSIAIGIKTQFDSKIRIIKGTKYFFDLMGYSIIDNKLTITNNILYSAEDGEELCIVVDFNFSSGSNCTINSKKSIIKLLYIQ